MFKHQTHRKDGNEPADSTASGAGLQLRYSDAIKLSGHSVHELICHVGVDMSESAVESANAAMRASLGESAPVSFHISDMLSYLKNVRGAFDIVVAAFALHHLTSEDKQQVHLYITTSQPTKTNTPRLPERSCPYRLQGNE